MGRRLQAWSVGDIFTVGLKDGQYAVGQVVSHEPQVLNSVGLALFDPGYRRRMRPQPRSQCCVTCSQSSSPRVIF